MDQQPTLLDLPAPSARVISVAGVTNPVVQVVLDISVPGFDFPLDYLVPENLSEAAQVGMSVQVRLAGSRRDGWIVRRTDTTVHQGKLAPILKVNYQAPQISPRLYALARLVATRYCGSVADVISAAKPKRVASVEKEFGIFSLEDLPEGDPEVALRTKPEPEPASLANSLYHPSYEVFSDYSAGKAWLDHLGAGESPRAVWDCLPCPENDWAEGLVESAIASLESGRGAVLLMPTAAAVERLMTVIRARGLASLTANLHFEVGPTPRYRDYLKVLHGDVRIVVGTQSAALAPLENVGLFACFDDGDQNFISRQAPYFHAARVLAMRAEAEGAAFLTAGYSRSLESQLLVESGWAAPIVPSLEALTNYVPSVMVPSLEERFENEGEAGLRRFPTSAYRLVKQALQTGPVLFQVPRSGYVNALVCGRCGQRLRCSHCGGPAVSDAQNRLRCQWCQKDLTNQSCANCGASKWRSRAIGSSRTAQELGKMFKGFPITISGAGSVMVESVDDSPRLVVATHGSEPAAESGYAAVVVMDAYALVDRPELWAPSEAARRFFNALALVRPGGKGLVLGVSEPHLARALVNWDRGELARCWVEERRELDFPPVSRMVSVDGDYGDLLEFIKQAHNLDAEVIGPQPVGKTEYRLLLRVPLDQSDDFLKSLRDLMRLRSQRKEPKLTVKVDPISLW